MRTIQKQCAKIANSNIFLNIIIGLIILNAILVGLETYPFFAQFSTFIIWADWTLLTVFTLEIIIRLIGSSTLKSFFTEPWNVFDLIIVLSSIILAGSSYVMVLRILRVLRVLRAISIIPSLRKMVNALLLTIPSMGTIMLLLGLFFYVYGVIGTMLFQSISPEYFGSLHRTLLTLFQVITLESWASGVMYPILEQDPTSWWYFVTFILIGAFVIINLFVGVVVNNVEEASREESPSPTDIKLEKMEKDLKEIKKLLKQQHKD